MEKINWQGGFYSASIFLGCVIGAGFASGKEVFHYFVSFGTGGLIGVILCGLFFYFICKNTLELGARLKAPSFYCFLAQGPGPIAAYVFHMIATSFLFVVFGVMGSGFSALGMEVFMVPGWMGFLLYLAIMAFVLSGAERYLSILSAVLSPVMIVGISFLCLYVLIGKDLSVFTFLKVRQQAAPSVISALLYCGYNSLGAIPVLCLLHKLVPNRKTARFSAALCGGVFCLCLLLLTLALGGFYGEIKGLELPLLYIATLAGDGVRAVYFAVLLSAVVTTGAGCGFALRKGMGERRGSIFIICSASLIFCFFNFSFLVEKLYAFFGFFGIILFMLVIMENRHQANLEKGAERKAPSPSIEEK